MNTFPKTAVTVAGSVLLIGGLAVGGAVAPAFAHTPQVVAVCDSLSLTFTSYTVIAAKPASGGLPAVIANSTPNSVTVTIDGISTTEAFGTKYAKTIKLDGTVAHTYSVVLDAHDDDAYDRSYAGSTVACVPPTPTPTSTTPPATDAPTPPIPPATETPTPPAPSSPPVATPPVATPPVATLLVETPSVATAPVTAAPVATPPATTDPVTTPPVAVTPPVVATPPQPGATARATTTELAETGAPTWTVPGLVGALLAVVLGAAVLLSRRFRRA